MNWYKQLISNRVKVANIPFDTQTLEHDIHKEYGYKALNKNISPPVSQKIEEIFPQAKPIGGGFVGIAYDLQDGRILKLTTDQSEIVFANQFKQQNNPNIAQIYDIMFIDDNVYGIIIEKVKPLPKETQERLNVRSEKIAKDMLDHFPKFIDKEEDKAIKENPTINYLPEDILIDIEPIVLKTEDPMFIEYYNLLLHLYESTEQFLPYDATPSNVGFNAQGKMVLFDVGFTNVLQGLEGVPLSKKKKMKKKK